MEGTLPGTDCEFYRIWDLIQTCKKHIRFNPSRISSECVTKPQCDIAGRAIHGR